MKQKNIIQQTIVPIARVLPPNLLESLLNFPSKVGRFAYLGLLDRDLTVKYGLASGVKFNAGQYNPHTVLGDYEIPVQELLAEYLKPQDVFYDIGANVGFFTILAAKLVGKKGKVYSFEPEAENAAILKHNIELNNLTQVVAIEKAVSKITGVTKLWLTEYSGGHSIAPVGEKFDPEKYITINTVSIDELLQQQTIEPPTLVKIDVEGAEIDVLEGMSQTIDQWHPMIIYEVDDQRPEGLSNKREAIDHFLLSHGYEIKPLEASYLDGSWNVEHAIAIPK